MSKVGHIAKGRHSGKQRINGSQFFPVDRPLKPDALYNWRAKIILKPI